MQQDKSDNTCPVHSSTGNAGEGPKPVVAVTGASRGIGHAIVQQFYKNGWDVFTLARTPFSDKCPWAEGLIQHIETDLADAASIRRAADELKQHLPDGRLNAFINNAGISPRTPEGNRMGACDTPLDTFLTIQHVNLVAPYLFCRELLEPLRAARGAIVNVSSIAAHRVHPFAGAAYAVSKAGMSALTRELAHELGDQGIRVNAVAPGEIDTSILSPGTDELVESSIPMRRLGLPREVSEVIYFLASGQASYVNGSEIHINGGQHV